MNLYRDAMNSESSDWLPYERVATKLAHDSNFREAADTFLKYPGFYKTGAANRVALSNHASDAGSLLFWAGAFETARPLYEIAAGLNTGSGGEMSSAARLGLIAGDYELAMSHTLRRVQRYNSKFAMRDLIGLLTIFDESESAWGVINSTQQLFVEPELWTGALIAHRANGASVDDISQWAFSEGREDLRVERTLLPYRFVFQANVVDREVHEDLADQLRAIDPRPVPGSSGRWINIFR